VIVTLFDEVGEHVALEVREESGSGVNLDALECADMDYRL
jgi:hypothetical protein